MEAEQFATQIRLDRQQKDADADIARDKELAELLGFTGIQSAGVFVAERSLDFALIDADWTGYWPGTAMPVGTADGPPDAPEPEPVPRFSTDPSAMPFLREQLARRGWYVESLHEEAATTPLDSSGQWGTTDGCIHLRLGWTTRKWEHVGWSGCTTVAIYVKGYGHERCWARAAIKALQISPGLAGKKTEKETQL